MSAKGYAGYDFHAHASPPRSHDDPGLPAVPAAIPQHLEGQSDVPAVQGDGELSPAGSGQQVAESDGAPAIEVSC
jgi:hypothetical protein